MDSPGYLLGAVRRIPGGEAGRAEPPCRRKTSRRRAPFGGVAFRDSHGMVRVPPEPRAIFHGLSGNCASAWAGTIRASGDVNRVRRVDMYGPGYDCARGGEGTI